MTKQMRLYIKQSDYGDQWFVCRNNNGRSLIISVHYSKEAAIKARDEI